jgi:signal transduction histidine kinase
MLPESSPSLKNPLFVRIGLVFVLTSAAVLSATAAFLYMQYPHRDSRTRRVFRQNLTQYFEGLSRGLGSPPDILKAGHMASELGLAIHIEGRGMDWSSEAGMPPLAAIEFDTPVETQGQGMGRAEERLVCLTRQSGYSILYAFPGRPVFSLPWKQSLALIGLIALILALSYATVRWLLLPVVRARERLLVDVSHELKSPLSRIKLAAAMLPAGANQKSIARAAGEMDSMLSELLESERLKSSYGALNQAPLSLPALAASLAANYKGQKPGIKIIGGEEVPPIRADESKCAMALKNIVENSLKYSQGQKRPVEIRFSQDAAWLRVSVTDFGQGIPAEDLPLVFEPFYRVDKSRTKKTGGYGLGLSLCREIMRAHGGEARIQSAPGAGTEVTLSFPKN